MGAATCQRAVVKGQGFVNAVYAGATPTSRVGMELQGLRRSQPAEQ